jgi:malate dehydrogenase (oxaloacetate-decarboxylating)
MALGLKSVILCDRKGTIYKGREGLNWIKEEMAEISNLEMVKGSIKDALVGADIFIGVSGPNTVTPDMIKLMNKDPVVFAMANPIPEIMPDLAKEAGAAVVGTGRSDFPNQINNTLIFPGLFRGVFDCRASDINDAMKVAAAYGLANVISEDELTPEYVIPSPFDPRVREAVAASVAKAARESGVARI